MPEDYVVPYKTINVFIEQEYLKDVLEKTIQGVTRLSKNDQISFVKFFKKYITVLGFRDPARAPLQLRVNALASAFEEKDEVIPYTLSVWAKANKKLAKNVKGLVGRRRLERPFA